MGNLDDTLAKRMKQLGIKRQVDAAGVVEAAEKEIAKILPREDFEVISFKDGTLKVYVVSSPAANELQMHRDEIIEQLMNIDEKLKRIRHITSSKDLPKLS